MNAAKPDTANVREANPNVENTYDDIFERKATSAHTPAALD